MNILYKISRIRRWAKRIGLRNAISFEFQQTVKRPVVTFRHGGIGRTIHLRQGSSDVSVFEQVFIKDEFGIDLVNPKLIIDGGANCGLVSVYFACRFPGAKIIAVEPSSKNCELALRNISGLNVELIESALWSRTTHLKIENIDAAPWAFQCIEAKPSDPDAFEACDVKSLLSGSSCDLLKLDIEGAEVELFRDPEWLNDVSAIVVEIHGEEADLMIRNACKGWNMSRTGENLFLSIPTA